MDNMNENNEMTQDFVVYDKDEEGQKESNQDQGSFKEPQKPHKKKDYFKVIVSVCLVISLVCNGVLMFKVFGTQGSTNSSRVETVNVDVKSSLTEVIKKAKASTVGIAVYQDHRMAGSGSGVIYKQDGKHVYVITNHHVIANSQDIEVVYANGESVKAELVGSDRYGDIAVLKMSVNFEVSPFKIGDSELLDTGETVLAVGSPLGIEYAGTVTQGIVSAPKRSVSVDLNNDRQDDWDMNVIQTDAAINPGNSGGALINSVGELVGITSMKFASESVEGMGFALPINDAVNMVEQIISKGKVSRPVLGVSAVSLDGYSSYDLYRYRIETNLNHGIYVAEVQPGSAADHAGIRAKDVIIEFDGKEIMTYKDFLTTLYSKNPGDKVKLTINRQGQTKVIDVKLK